jgi:hypothetical protein
MPPHWNPEHALPPAEKEALRALRVAEEQVALATDCLAWAAMHGVDTSTLAPSLAQAKVSLETVGLTPEFYGRIDTVWTGLHERLPIPKGKGAPPPAPPPSAAEVEDV